MCIEPVPEIGLTDRVPGPVRRLRIEEDDPRLLIALVGVRPDVEIARGRARLCATGPLEPGMLIRGMIDDELGNDAQPSVVRCPHEPAEVTHGPVGRIDAAVLGDVVAVILERRGVERHDPDRRDTEIFDIIQLARESLEVADAVIVRIEERLDMQLINDCVAIPLCVVAVDHRPRSRCWPAAGISIITSIHAVARTGGCQSSPRFTPLRCEGG
jgi:hypothetical protein